MAMQPTPTKIKAAFEKLGCKNTNDFTFGKEDNLYFTFNGKVNWSCYEPFIEIIKTHPDYKELELPVESKFKVGNWICPINGKKSKQVRVIEVRSLSYLTEDRFGILCPISFSAQHEWRLWTIRDAKDGDVLATDNGWTCIFKAFDGWTFSSYCFMDSQNWFCEFGSEVHTPDSRINGDIHPATQKQRNFFFKKMQEAGYQWYAGKKELRKIQPNTTTPRTPEERNRTTKMDKAIMVLKEHNENDVCPKSELYQAIESAITVMTFFDDVMNKFGKED